MRQQLLFLTFFSFICSISAQDRIYVDAQSNSVVMIGVSWGTAYDSLHLALNRATSGDTILVGNGVYKPHPTVRDSSFVIPDGVTVLGGFSPSAGITDISQRDWVLYKSILSGDIGVTLDSTDNSYNVVDITPGISTVTIVDGFIIKEGNADGLVSSNKDGAGIKAVGSAIIRNCKINNNSSEHEGGGLDVRNDVDIVDCTFANNSSFIGSAMNASSWTGTLSGSTFKNNYALNTFVETIRLSNSDCTMESVDIDNNIGIGIKQFGGTLTLNSSYIRNNTGQVEAAISTNSSATIHINNCQISHNTSVEGRGSWYIGSDCIATALNTTIAYNEATDLTAGIALAGQLSSTNLIVSNNKVPLDPMTSNFRDYVGASHTVKNSLFRKSGGSSNWDVGIGSDYGNNIDADPQFIDTISLALSGCSLAKDVGFDTTGLLSLDLAGLTRVMGIEVDIGAHEYVPGSDNEEGCISFSQRVHVDKDATGLNDGSTWNNAFIELYDAINIADVGDTILVAEGTYHPSVNFRDSSFYISKQLVLLGGFDPGLGAYNLSARDWNHHPSILSGDIGLLGDTIDNNYTVMLISGSQVDSTTVIDGFFIQGGVGNNGGVGSGLDVFSSSPTLKNLTIRSNYNTAVRLQESFSTLENCDIRDNKNGAGAGIYIRFSDVKLLLCLILSNTTTSIGGGIYSDDSTIDLDRTFIYGNTAQQSGAAYFFDSEVTLDGCFISDNEAEETGGITVAFSKVDLSNSILSYNTATVEGAGAASISSGGVLNNYNSTITFNTGIETGGIRVINSFGTKLQNNNSIIYGNDIGGNTTSDQSQIILYASSEVYNKNSIIGNSGGSSAWNSSLGVDQGGNLDVDPMFTELIEMRLHPLSLAIDAGINDSIIGDWDLGGAPRLTGSTVDIGANEYYNGFYWTGDVDHFDWSNPFNWSELRTPILSDTVLLYTYDEVVIPTNFQSTVMKVVNGKYASLVIDNNPGANSGKLQIQDAEDIALLNYGQVVVNGLLNINNLGLQTSGMQNHGDILVSGNGKITLKDGMKTAILNHEKLVNKGEIELDEGALETAIQLEPEGYFRNDGVLSITNPLASLVNGLVIRGQMENRGTVSINLANSSGLSCIVHPTGSLISDGIFNILQASDQPLQVDGEFTINGEMDIQF